MKLEFAITSTNTGWLDWERVKSMLYQSTHWDEIAKDYDIYQLSDSGEWVLMSEATYKNDLPLR
jgi:hypothetical protein